MKKKCELIREIAKECTEHGAKELCLVTKIFKAKGKLYTEKEIEGLITLKPAVIKLFADDCECETTSEHKEIEWLNIFAEDIIAFSIK